MQKEKPGKVTTSPAAQNISVKHCQQTEEKYGEDSGVFKSVHPKCWFFSSELLHNVSSKEEAIHLSISPCHEPEPVVHEETFPPARWERVAQSKENSSCVKLPTTTPVDSLRSISRKRHFQMSFLMCWAPAEEHCLVPVFEQNYNQQPSHSKITQRVEGKTPFLFKYIYLYLSYTYTTVLVLLYIQPICKIWNTDRKVWNQSKSICDSLIILLNSPTY